MDVILHVGAHRTGCGSLQDYMHRHAAAFEGRGIAFWGPGLTDAKGCDAPAFASRTPAQVQARVAAARVAGMHSLVVSDVDILGTLARNIAGGSLYPDARAALSRITALFDGQLQRILLSPRSLDHYWCSALACGITRGLDVPSRDRLHAIATSDRGWRDVIADIAAAAPQARIDVLPFERFAGRPEALLARGAAIDAPLDQARVWLNRAPTLPDLRRTLRERGQTAADLPFGMGRWNPFTNEEHAALREMQADDMMWLTAGADGLARLTEDGHTHRAGQTPPVAAHRKGHDDECEKRDMAQPRQG